MLRSHTCLIWFAVRLIQFAFHVLFCKSLYVLNPSMLRYPVQAIISCSSTPLWKRRVAVITRSEWFILNPGTPPAWHTLATVLARVLCPIGVFVYHTASFGFFRGVRYSAGSSIFGRCSRYFLYMWTRHRCGFSTLAWWTTRFGCTFLCEIPPALFF